ncbi:TIR domain-containing protein [Candidatus Lokiarchaeum ossiferum]|uniref:TIR domain-containing protein n=1 Tax=Candidatus Lokiarchaeum ossiferum TaxID=2951803 RepID=UPI00352DBFE1
MVISSNIFKPFLEVHFILHPRNEKYTDLFDFFKTIYSSLVRDIDEPVNRGIGIPNYFWNDISFQNISIENSFQTIIFLLIDDFLILDEQFKEKIIQMYDKIKKNKHHFLIPIALSKNAFNFEELNHINFIRFYEFKPDQQFKLLEIQVFHQIYRLLYNSYIKTELNNEIPPLNVFLSHSKKDGAHYAEIIRDIIPKITQIKTFYDVNDIRYGSSFKEEIENGILNSFLLVIKTDSYSSREWCRKEVLLAKNCQIPILIVDFLTKYENRQFPYIGNVPFLKINRLEIPEIIIILREILIQSLKSIYNKIYLENLKDFWFNVKDSEFIEYNISNCAPELLTLVNIKEAMKSSKLLIYPDPPLGVEELEIFKKFDPDCSILTPIQLFSEIFNSNFNNQFKIGISISDPNEINKIGLTEYHIQDIFIELARYFLCIGAVLVYGGNLDQNGFTQKLFDLVERHKRDNLKFKKVENYLCWPYYLLLSEHKEAELSNVATIFKIGIDDNLSSDFPDFEGMTSNEKQKFESLLTKMREDMNDGTDCRIIMGGRTFGFKGKYPGIIEESLIAIKSEKPIYFLGGFGGAAKIIVELVCKNEISIKLPTEIQTFFSNLQVDDLNNGLSKSENYQLFNSTNIFEIITLILKGFQKCFRSKKNYKLAK